MSLLKPQSLPRAGARVLTVSPISPRIIPADTCLRQYAPQQRRAASTIPKVKVKNPLVELDGDEVFEHRNHGHGLVAKLLLE